MIEEIHRIISAYEKRFGVKPTKLYLTQDIKTKLMRTPEIQSRLLYNHQGEKASYWGLLICKSEYFCWVGD